MLNLATARQWYPNGDAVHGFDHIERVYGMCQRIGREEGADMEILLAAALLHDSQGSHPGQGQRNDHHLRSAEFAAEVLAAEGWGEERIRAAQHCIRAHRYRDLSEQPATLEAKILFDADKLDVLGAIGVVRVLGYAQQAGQPAYAPPSQAFIRTGEDQPGEPHSAYHEHLFKLRNVHKRLFTNEARRIAADRSAFLDAFFERLIDEFSGER